MRMLIGDTGGSGAVSSTDVSQVRLQSGSVAGAGNFRTDVLVSGAIGSGDISDVRLHSGTNVP